jgi:hypothetical protein
LNVAPDLTSFDVIHPCGLRGIRMTSVERRLGDRSPSLATMREAVAREVARRFGHEELVWTPPAEPWKLVMDETTAADHRIEERFSSQGESERPRASA